MCIRDRQMAASNVDDPSALCYLISSAIKINTEEKQELLEETDVEKRLRKLTVILTRELEVFELGSKIQSDVQSELDKNQREYFPVSYTHLPLPTNRKHKLT